MNLIVDANSLITRSFHAFPENEEKTWAIYGFLNMLLDIVKKYNPKTIHFCFDDRDNWRKVFYPEYKCNRKPKPEFLPYQIDLLKTTLKRVGLSIYQHPSAEADDLIATLCNDLRGEHTILSSDKDLIQLVGVGTTYIRYTDHFRNHEVLTLEKVEEKYGFGPDKIKEYMALLGDVSDNIPGVKMIGPKKAKKLIQAYGSVYKIGITKDNDPDAWTVRRLIDKAELSLKLVTLSIIPQLKPQSGDYTVSQLHKVAEIVRG
jgi:DNA polymerase-1